MKRNLAFRSWYYFRMGWATYFAFIFAAVNTLTVTYFLAIENYPSLQVVFPSFVYYIVIVSLIGVPLLVGIGYIHFKKSPSFRAESAVFFESNPFVRRTLINSELTLKINQELISLLLKMQKGEKIDDDILEQVQKTQTEISRFVEKRTIFSKEDSEFLKKLQGND